MIRDLADRRAFMQNLLCLGAAAAATMTRSSVVGSPLPTVDGGWDSSVAHMIRHKYSAYIIGQACLDSLPEAYDRSALNKTILESIHLSPAAAEAMDRSQLHERLRARVQADFREQQTVKIDGWILSLTEVRLTALIALS